mmetsp:Transcript_27655/g.87887  ORF Transcript_27655/g.87887 Transcript_27655/m.87887 type:complete len:476 (-) Transcript_27655:384-1811(-)
MALPAPREEEILRLVAERESLRQARRFAESDAIREQLRSSGVELYDKEREWRSRDGRRGELFTAGPAQCCLSDSEIYERIAQREDARTVKDWASADSLRDELRRQGVELDDRLRTWRTSAGRSGSYSGQARASAGTLSEPEIRLLVAERERARASQDFAAADGLRVRLLRMGVEVFDAERTWRANDGRQGVIVTGGGEIVHCGLTDTEVQVRVQAREEARAQRDWERADCLRDELRRLGVELVDSEQKWRTTDGRMGPYALPQQLQWLAPGCNSEAPAAGAPGGATETPGILQAAQEALARLREQYVLQQEPPGQPPELYGAAAGQAHAAAAQAQAQAQGAVGQAPAVAPALSDASIQALVAGREAVREGQDFEAADAIRQDLRQHGVEVWDEQGAWGASDGRQGPILPATAAARLGAPAPAPQPALALQQALAMACPAKGLAPAAAGGATLAGAGLPISADLAAVLALAGRIPA